MGAAGGAVAAALGEVTVAAVAPVIIRGAVSVGTGVLVDVSPRSASLGS
jgi:hypothetical protein